MPSNEIFLKDDDFLINLLLDRIRYPFLCPFIRDGFDRCFCLGIKSTARDNRGYLVCAIMASFIYKNSNIGKGFIKGAYHISLFLLERTE